MTENEALKELNVCIGNCVYVGCGAEAMHEAIKALNEIKQYRAIGTVERFKQLSEQFKPHVTDKTSCSERHCNKCDKYRKENEKYHEIGTVEECREAMEKQKPKLPNIWGDGCGNEGNMIYDMYDCPNCGKSYEIDYDDYKYCPECGQAIDWMDE